jgi:O-antigen/teichoic acid export membrane protein
MNLLNLFSETWKLRYHRFVHIRSEFALVGIGQIAAALGGIFSVKLLTNHLSPEEYGCLSLGITICGMLNLLFYGPFGVLIARFFPIFQERSHLSRYFHQVKKILGFSSVIFLSLGLSGGYFASHFLGEKWGILVFIAVLFTIVSGLNGALFNVQNAIRQRKIIAFHQGLDSWLRPGIALLLISWTTATGHMALLGYFFGTLAVTISQGIFAFRNPIIREGWCSSQVPDRSNSQDFHELMTYLAPVVLFGVFSGIFSFSDRWFLQAYLGEREVGIYSAVIQIANAPMALFVGIINQFVVPILFARAGSVKTPEQVENSNKILHAIALLYFGVMVIGFLVVSWFDSAIIEIFTGEIYSAHGQLLRLLVVALSLFQIAQVLNFKGFYMNCPQLYLVPKVIQASSMLLLGFFLGKPYGMTGMALALCGSSLCYLLATLHANSKMTFASLESNAQCFSHLNKGES